MPASSNNDDQTVGFSQSDVQRMINEALERDRAERSSADNADVQRMIDEALERDRRERSTAERLSTAVNPVPAHAGGPGTDIAETWSAYDQDLATRGEHPLQREAPKR